MLLIMGGLDTYACPSFEQSIYWTLCTWNSSTRKTSFWSVSITLNEFEFGQRRERDKREDWEGERCNLSPIDWLRLWPHLGSHYHLFLSACLFYLFIFLFFYLILFLLIFFYFNFNSIKADCIDCPLDNCSGTLWKSEDLNKVVNLTILVALCKCSSLFFHAYVIIQWHSCPFNSIDHDKENVSKPLLGTQFYSSIRWGYVGAYLSSLWVKDRVTIWISCQSIVVLPAFIFH